jgi:hypothetical protein
LVEPELVEPDLVEPELVEPELLTTGVWTDVFVPVASGPEVEVW